jgi:hypothetical protein
MFVFQIFKLKPKADDISDSFLTGVSIMSFAGNIILILLLCNHHMDEPCCVQVEKTYNFSMN